MSLTEEDNGTPHIEHYEDPVFQQHILGGIKWAINKKGKLDYTNATTKLIID